jgi:adenine-specific DNA methylase
MAVFEAKALPTDEKLRGGYYTPSALAEFVGNWVAQAGPALLEPSCGDGNILQHLADHSPLAVGVELFASEARKAEARTGAPVYVDDFFDWFTSDRHGAFDGVAGNPPYIRFGNWVEPSRSTALSMMRDVGLRPSKLTNAWVPFVVGSVLACREGGRVGLVVPAELLQVGYASELRKFLVESCSSVTVVGFKQLVFPGILQEVVLLLAEKGQGPAQIQVLEVDDAAALGSLQLDKNVATQAPLGEGEKWSKYFLATEDIEFVRSLRSESRLRAMEHYASVDVGVVTGRNAFFVMTPEEAASHQVSDLTIPLVSRSAQLSGLVYTDADHQAGSESGSKTALLDARGVALADHPGLAAYVELGEDHSVHTGYKCRIRKHWWVVPSIWEADAFMLRQIHTHPRVIANDTTATSTDTVHRLRIRPGADAGQLATASYNSFTFAVSEIVGRSYGGGILELEPSEAEELPIPDPSLVTRELTATVDALVRAKRVDDALDLVDRAILVEGLGFAENDVRHARQIWVTLRDRRLRRGKR